MHPSLYMDQVGDHKHNPVRFVSDGNIARAGTVIEEIEPAIDLIYDRNQPEW